MNPYLVKIAGIPGSFIAAARKSAVESISNTGAKAAHSGLRTGGTVSRNFSQTPRVIQNRTGMNRGALLNKVAEMVVNNDESLPYRRRVEVAIFKGDKVLLTKNKDEESGNKWYAFPGGGTEGEKDSVAAEKECLEEVGVAVKNLKKTEVLEKEEGINAKKGREGKYRGTLTRVFTAEFDHYNDAKLGDDGDDVPFVWKTIPEAIKLLGEKSFRSRTLGP
jgi:8-oxo-dGTP pyrophosphatase MutT (NUDIX family)